VRGRASPSPTITGTEDSGTWQHVDLEIHASLAVSYGIWHHEVVLRDKAFLHREGIEMLLQICRFLASAGGLEPLEGRLRVLRRHGARRVHMMVNHNCYTNVLGKKTFEFTLAVLGRDAVQPLPTCTARLWQDRAAPDEPDRWPRWREACGSRETRRPASSSSTPATSTCPTSTSSTSRPTRSPSTSTGRT